MCNVRECLCPHCPERLSGRPVLEGCTASGGRIPQGGGSPEEREGKEGGGEEYSGPRACTGKRPCN